MALIGRFSPRETPVKPAPRAGLGGHGPARLSIASHAPDRSPPLTPPSQAGEGSASRPSLGRRLAFPPRAGVSTSPRGSASRLFPPCEGGIQGGDPRASAARKGPASTPSKSGLGGL